jgi:hypothetical protein
MNTADKLCEMNFRGCTNRCYVAKCPVRSPVDNWTKCKDNNVDCMSMSRVRDLTAPMNLGLIKWSFVPHVQSREPRNITEAPDGPQTCTLIIFRLQKDGAQMCMSEGGQGLTFTKNIGRPFLHHPTFPTQRTTLQS